MTKLKELYEIYPIFKEINEKNNNVIEINAIFKSMYKGESISSAKDSCKGIMFVMNGKINIHRINENGDEMGLYSISSGELCHEALSCLLNFKSLNILGECIEAAEVCIIPINIVERYLLSNNKFLAFIYKDLYIKFNIMIEKREEKLHDSVLNRLVKVLINKNSRIIYITHRDIALEIDSTREVVSRNLKKIERDGYIKLERGKITILKDLRTIKY